MANGRPLWFIGGVVVAWAGARVAMLWPAAPPLPTGDARPVKVVEPVAIPVNAIGASSGVRRPVITTTNVRRHRLRATATPPRLPIETTAVIPAAQSAFPTVSGKMVVAAHGDFSPDITATVVAPLVATAPRLRLDTWLVARPGGGDTLAFGRLGASQGGARLTYTLDRRVALSGRVSAPLRGTGREIGIGLELKPTRLPVHVLVEQRIDVDTGATRPAIVAIAGGSIALPWRARIDAYAQAGGVRRRGGFVDAATIVSRPLVTRGRMRLELGGGAWGAAQRGVGRLDVGPAVALVTPGAGGTLRLQVDYRVRLAGRARPGSGPALTLGGSF